GVRGCRGDWVLEAGGTLDLGVVRDDGAFLHHGDAAFLRHLPAGIEARGAEDDVESLPLQRRLAGVHQRRGLAVDGAAVALPRLLETVGVGDLDFIPALQPDAAVPLLLPVRL